MMAWRFQGRKGLTRDGVRPPCDEGEGADSTLQHRFSAGVILPPPRGHLAISRNIFYITTQGEGCTWHLARDAAKCPTVHSIILCNEERNGSKDHW